MKYKLTTSCGAEFSFKDKNKSGDHMGAVSLIQELFKAGDPETLSVKTSCGFRGVGTFDPDLLFIPSV